MCGLVGITSVKDLTVDDRKFFRDLIVIDTLRGPHSTGLFSVTPNNEVNVLKKNIDGLTFTTTLDFEKRVFKEFLVYTLAGHNRWATVGKVNHDNAHPFTHGPITMMHNGTLISQKTLEKADEFGTDSECIAYNLSIKEPDKAGEVISKIYGAFALVWYDARDMSLNFIRNDERTLYITTDDDEKPTKFAWASEEEMLTLCKNRDKRNTKLTDNTFLLKAMSHIKCIKNNTDPNNIYYDVGVQKYEEYVPPKVAYNSGVYITGGGRGYGKSKKNKGTSDTSTDNVISFNKGKSSKEIRRERIPSYFPDCGTTVPIILYGFNPYSKNSKVGVIEGLYTYKNDIGNQDYLHVEVHNVNKDLYDEMEETMHEFKGEVVIYNNKMDTMYAQINVEDLEWDADDKEQDELFDMDNDVANIPGPYGTMINMRTYLKLTKDGCSHCSANLLLTDAHEVHWVAENGEPLCDECGSMRSAGLL